MNARIKPPPPSERVTLRLTLDLDRIPGDRVAALVEEVRSRVGDQVRLTELRSEPVVLELSGPRPALEELRAAILHEGLRRLHRSWRPTVSPLRRHVQPLSRRGRLVLLVDGDDPRARRDADVLSRAGLETCVAGSVTSAVALLQHTRLEFDAVVMRHHVAMGNGLQVLDRVRPERRRCSVLVVDDEARPAVARAYRARGVFRYVPQPDGPLQLIGRVHSTVFDTQAWRSVEDPGAVAREEPPRQLVDPEQAADRLQYVCCLSSLEREVASMMLRGLRDIDIADCLGKSERTAKRHVSKVLEKAGVDNRASLWSVLHQDAIGELPPRAAEGPAEAEAELESEIDPETETESESEPEPEPEGSDEPEIAAQAEIVDGDPLPLGSSIPPRSRPAARRGTLRATLPAA